MDSVTRRVWRFIVRVVELGIQKLSANYQRATSFQNGALVMPSTRTCPTVCTNYGGKMLRHVRHLECASICNAIIVTSCCHANISVRGTPIPRPTAATCGESIVPYVGLTYIGLFCTTFWQFFYPFMKYTQN